MPRRPLPSRLTLIALLFATGTVFAGNAGAHSAPGTDYGVDVSARDPEVRPQDDLFRAVNGGWLRTTEVPADKTQVGAFHALRDLSDERVKTILDESMAATAPAKQRKIGDFYAAYLDLEAIDRSGLKPLQPLLKEVDAIEKPADLAALLGRWQGVAGGPLALVVQPGADDSRTYRPILYQSGLGLPDRDYYLSTIPKLVAARDAYRRYVETLLGQLGEADPKAKADRVLALETRIAQLHWDKVDNRDPVKTHNRISAEALAERAPGLDWQRFFAAAGDPKLDGLSVSQPSYVDGLAKLVASEPLDTWRAYLKARAANRFGPVLPKAFRDAWFAFNEQTLGGQKQPKPRWKYAVDATNDALGEAIGEIYVARHFPPESKAKMMSMVKHLVAGYEQSIRGLSWMTDETKQRALEKLAKYRTKIGYPEQWRDYSKVEVKRDDPLGNVARAARVEYERRTQRSGQPVDRGEWGMTPQTVNAYYSPRMNEIVFPAAILQPPFFNPKADDAVNYGGIGAVIGHEISHGFDDKGSQYDGDGNLKNWWTPADRKAFEALGSRLVKQYESYEPLPGQKINGKLTLGENIADLSGLQIAYKAYRLSLGGKDAPVINGATGDQRFFYGFAQVWRTKIRDESLLTRLLTDTHSPGQFRANGATVNADAFHRAFGTKPGDGMFKAEEERIRIW